MEIGAKLLEVGLSWFFEDHEEQGHTKRKKRKPRARAIFAVLMASQIISWHGSWFGARSAVLLLEPRIASLEHSVRAWRSGQQQLREQVDVDIVRRPAGSPATIRAASEMEIRGQ